MLEEVVSESCEEVNRNVSYLAGTNALQQAEQGHKSDIPLPLTKHDPSTTNIKQAANFRRFLAIRKLLSKRFEAAHGEYDTPDTTMSSHSTYSGIILQKNAA
jgi:hypothetical protein